MAIIFRFQLLFLSSLLVLSHHSIAQDKTLLVTDFYHNELASFSAKVLPDYFRMFPAKTQYLKSVLDSVVHTRYEATTRYYDEGPKCIFIDSLLEQGERIGYREHLKKTAKKENDDYFLRIRSFFQSVPMGKDGADYQLLLGVKVIDKNSKKALRQTIKIPFYSTRSDSVIHSQSILSPEDFFLLYETGVRQLFTKNPQKQKILSCLQPKNTAYSEFIRTAKWLTMKRKSSNAMQITDLANSPVLEASFRRGWQSEDESGWLTSVLDLNQKITLKNSMTEPWKGNISANSKKFLDFLEISAYEAHVEIKIGHNVYSLDMISGRSLKGSIGKHHYELRHYDSVLSEFYLDGTLIALTQPGSKKSLAAKMVSSNKVFIHPSESDQLPIVSNLFTLFFEAEALLDEASEKN